MTQIDWEAVRRSYEVEGLTPRELAQRFGVGYSTVTRHIREEGWQAPREKRSGLAALVEQLSDTVQETLERLRTEDKADIRSVKDLTAALRELANLEKSLESESGDTVRVVLSAEVEEWSQ